MDHFQALVLLTLVTDGIELDRLGSGGVFGILDTIGEAISNIDFAGKIDINNL